MPLSIAEQVHLEAINRARANPIAEAYRLGIDLNEGLNPGTIPGTPVPPVVHNQDLQDAAIAHAAWELANDTMSHTGSGGSTPGERIIAEGYDYSQYAENLAGYTTGSSSPENTAAQLMHDALFIDSGVDGRGHRRSILDPNLKEIGIGMVYGEFAGDDYTHLAVDDYATTFAGDTYFLCGVVFQDSNADGMYTGGEGLSGIAIVIKQGVTTIDSTTTGTAGDYTFTLPAGDYTVIATLPTHGDVSKDFSIINQNVKVDFRYHPSITEAPVINFGSDIDTIQTINANTLRFIPQNTDSLPSRAILYWSVTNAYVTYLNGAPVSNSGTIQVTPETTTVYKLESFGPAGESVAEITITSLPWPPFNRDKKTFPELK
jgi:hypothetical protein